jgi:integrase
MGRPTIPGIYRGEDGRWNVDKVIDSRRFRHDGEPSYAEAEGWLLKELSRPPAEPAVVAAAPILFDAASAHYVSTHEKKVSLELDVYLLGLVMPYVGQLPIDQVHNGTLQPFKDAMQAGEEPATRPLKAKTINLALDRVRRILTLCARLWRDGDGKPWLKTAPPLIQMLPEDDEREPMQLAWKEQRENLPGLPAHLARMALFDLNTGLRDEPLCNLRWRWEVRLPELGFSVFVVPRRYVKGRKADRVLVCNSVAQSIIESVRGMHPEYVFVYSQRVKTPKYRPIATMNNTAWQNWRASCGLDGFRVHDMRHTVGMRLREAGVSEATRADILWHSHSGMTAHYSVAQALEIRDALELITSERHTNNVSLATIIRQSRVPAEVPAVRKTA